MPNIYLGPQGSETLLPPLNWLNGQPPSLPVPKKKALEKSNQLDGSVRYNIKPLTPKSFSLEWARLTEAQLDALDALSDINAVLRYQNNWTDATWRNVVVTSFEWAPMLQTFAGATPFFRASLTLEEVL